jgi:plasmid stabilization system protein ParE
MKFRFHEEAEAELLRAVDYYEARAAGLGHDFAVEVYSAIQLILAMPKAWPVLEGEVRRCLARRFPYGILYVEEEDHVLVLALMSLHRDPDSWKARLR